MAKRLEANFDRAVDASLREVGRDDLDEQLNKYLADAHAIEAQAIQLLEKGPISPAIPSWAACTRSTWRRRASSSGSSSSGWTPAAATRPG